MKSTLSAQVSILILGAVLAVSGVNLPVTKIRLTVIDQDNRSVADADVVVAGTAHGGDGAVARGKTDQNGIYYSEVGSSGDISVKIAKNGWYPSEYWKAYTYLTTQDVLQEAFATGVWPSDAAITAVLKQVRNPIPMFARKVSLKVPVEGADVGFDLESGDWVTPYGSGVTPDLVFRVDRRIINDREFHCSLVLSFSHKEDGVGRFEAAEHAGSILLSPHLAPDDGYSPQQLWRQERVKLEEHQADKFNTDERAGQNYFLRVRTMMENGRITSARYGKLYGDVHFYAGTKAPHPGIAFTYYLNPTPNDRNIEFDPKRNLFTNLKPDERVTEP